MQLEVGQLEVEQLPVVHSVDYDLKNKCWVGDCCTVGRVADRIVGEA